MTRSILAPSGNGLNSSTIASIHGLNKASGRGTSDWDKILSNFDTLDALLRANVLTFGAVADEQTVTDGAITQGSTTLTSASGLFSSGDVGKSIVVNGAGTANAVQTGVGDNLTTTIAAYVSATQITLTAAAGTTVNNATVSWGTDNTLPIQNALNAVSQAGGGELYCPAGQYLVMGRLSIPSYGPLNSIWGPGYTFSLPTTVPGSGSNPATQYLAIPIPNGTFTLGFSGSPSAPIAYNATATQIQAALNVAGVLGVGAVTVTANGPGFNITWNANGTRATLVFICGYSQSSHWMAPIKLTGAGSVFSWLWPMLVPPPGAGGTILDMRYVGSGVLTGYGTDAKLLIIGGQGRVEINNIAFVNRQYDINKTPFILSTLPMIDVHHCSAHGTFGPYATNPYYGAGNYQRQNPPDTQIAGTCPIGSQDFLWLGASCGAPQDTGQTTEAPYTGYGSTIHDNFFDSISRGVWARDWCNGLQVKDNTFGFQCWCQDDAGYIDIGMAAQLTALVYVQEPGNAVLPCIQILSIPNSGGTFTIGPAAGSQSTPIAYNASNTTIQNALNAVLGAGTVTVTALAGAGGPQFSIAWNANGFQNLLALNASGLTGIGNPVAIAIASDVHVRGNIFEMFNTLCPVRLTWAQGCFVSANGYYDPGGRPYCSALSKNNVIIEGQTGLTSLPCGGPNAASNTTLSQNGIHVQYAAGGTQQSSLGSQLLLSTGYTDTYGTDGIAFGLLANLKPNALIHPVYGCTGGTWSTTVGIGVATFRSGDLTVNAPTKDNFMYDPDGNLDFLQAGGTIQINENANGAQGQATLNGTVGVTVTTTACTTNSRIFLTTCPAAGSSTQYLSSTLNASHADYLWSGDGTHNAVAVYAQAPASGTINSLQFYDEPENAGNNQNVQLAIYTYGNAGAIVGSPLWSSSPITLNGSGWRTITVSPGVSVTSGTNYTFVVVNTRSNAGAPYPYVNMMHSTVSGQDGYQVYWPNDTQYALFPNGTVTQTGSHFYTNSMYANISVPGYSGAVGTPYVSAQNAGNFTIKSTQSGDLSNCSWLITRPVPATP